MLERDQIIAQALELSPEDRAFIVEALEESLDNRGFGSPDIAEARRDEIKSRLRAFDCGKIVAVEGTGLAEIRRSLQERRIPRAQT